MKKKEDLQSYFRRKTAELAICLIVFVALTAGGIWCCFAVSATGGGIMIALGVAFAIWDAFLLRRMSKRLAVAEEEQMTFMEAARLRSEQFKEEGDDHEENRLGE